MSSLESAVERRVRKWADERGLMNAKFTPMGQAGYPDRIFFFPGGKPLLIEFKKEGEVPEPLQAEIIRKLRTLGYDVRWTWSAERAIEWLTDEITKVALNQR